jgi:heme exporter protein D
LPGYGAFVVVVVGVVVVLLVVLLVVFVEGAEKNEFF